MRTSQHYVEIAYAAVKSSRSNRLRRTPGPLRTENFQTNPRP